MLRNASVPLGISTPGQPNISSTLWRSVADHKHRRYYFESSRTPNVFWVNLADVDFAKGAATRKLTLSDGSVHAGNAAGQFNPADPFVFLPTDGK